MKKYLAEMIGTMVLVLMGCGTAVSLGCNPVGADLRSEERRVGKECRL